MIFLLFLLIPILGLAYTIWHLYLLMPFPAVVRVAVCAVCVAAVLLIVADFARWVDHMPMPSASLVYEIGTTALIVLMYVFMFFLLLDILRLLHIVPKTWLNQNLWTLLVLVVGIAALIHYGNRHYNNKHRQPLQLTTHKPLGKDMTFVMVSDLHLGYHNRRQELHRWVEMINREHADAILIAGDIIDISVRPLIEDSMAAELRGLNAPVFACLGNHEYYSGEPEAQRFFDQAGIHLLRDTAITFKNDVIIAGRDDRTNPRRRPLHDILSTTDRAKYTILLDHQPYHLEQAQKQGVDFQLSGHTHHGQVWPISWITEQVYEKAYGAHRRSHTHYYITSGLGIWGAKVRIGTRSEYVVATLRHAEKPE